MATVKFLLRGKSNPSNLYLRFSHTREIDVFQKTQILINPSHWDLKKEQIKNLIAVKNKDEVNLKLSELKIHILTNFNTSYMRGEIIDKVWIANQVNEFFHRPVSELNFKIKKEEVFFTSFASWWLKEIAPTYKISAKKYMTEITIKHYERTRDLFIEFEQNNQIKIADIDNKTLDAFSQYLTQNKQYSTSTVERQISRAKFFCQRAEKMNLKVNKSYQETVYVEQEEIEYKEPYLNIDEINSIFNLKIQDKKTDAIRDNFIIGLWTGLRVSDFLNQLLIDHIQGDFIVIETTKTKQKVAIPLHEQIKLILKKWDGLPPKTNDQDFNLEIKEICQIAKINNVIIGGKTETTFNEKTGKNITRKTVGKYKKYELVTSHICRRSFATNLFGKLQNKVIMDVCGWKSEKQMLEYNKQTNKQTNKLRISQNISRILEKTSLVIWKKRQ
ncbi:tyrosine-type recombinase/integrase [Myroides odoratus]|uniref:tyrosine-type recombinase/integrase n=1 Tax=Myroides odoratus TaxID=256 RepID=UPI0039B0EA40